MAKIYDALRKAEADRQRKVGGGVGSERLDWEPENAEPAKPSSAARSNSLRGCNGHGFTFFQCNRNTRSPSATGATVAAVALAGVSFLVPNNALNPRPNPVFAMRVCGAVTLGCQRRVFHNTLGA